MPERLVYVVDDEEAIRRSASLLLRISGYEPKAFDGGQAFLDAEAALPAGCILLDIRMPDIDGIAVQQRLIEQQTKHATIVMTGHGDVRSAVAALDSGAVTFIEKPFSKDQLLPAIEFAFCKLNRPDDYQELLRAARNKVCALSDREQAVLLMLGQDMSSDQIGTVLQRSPAEIDNSRALIMKQLSVESIPAALTIAAAAQRAD